YPVKAIDGYDNPWAYPQVPLVVGSNQTSITYANPSTTSIQDTTAHSEATLNTAGATGQAYFDLGTTTAYGFIADGPVDINASNCSSACLVYDNWGPPALTPGTTYHWRLRFLPTGGDPNNDWLTGADQFFTTSGTAPTDTTP